MTARPARECISGYAGYPLVALDGTPLGLIAVVSRQPLAQLERIESMLQIFAVRAAAEIERLIASEALQRSEASYRAIFEAVRGRDLHPRLGQRGDPRCQPEGLRGLRLQPRRTVPGVAGRAEFG